VGVNRPTPKKPQKTTTFEEKLVQERGGANTQEETESGRGCDRHQQEPKIKETMMKKTARERNEFPHRLSGNELKSPQKTGLWTSLYDQVEESQHKDVSGMATWNHPLRRIITLNLEWRRWHREFRQGRQKTPLT